MTKKSPLKTIKSWLAVLIWMGIIFSFSCQNDTQSGGLSEEIMLFLARLIHRLAPGASLNLDILHLIVRKTAHFTIYFILGILVANALHPSSKQKWLIAFAACVLYALSDELHQLFVPGRVFSLTDVGIDSLGSLLGLGVFGLMHHGISLRKQKRLSSD